MIDHKHKAIFVHIQKTGGSSISAALGHDPAHPQKHYTALELRALCDAQTWQNHYKFSFVRNPWSRLVSWWSMIDGHRPAFAAGARLNGFQQSVLQRAGNFQEFLENLDEDIVDTDGRKWIFRNQIDYLTDENGAMLVDFVGRTERMGQDSILSPRACLDIRSISADTTSRATPPTRPYYTPMLVEIVAPALRA